MKRFDHLNFSNNRENQFLKEWYYIYLCVCFRYMQEMSEAILVSTETLLHFRVIIYEVEKNE